MQGDRILSLVMATALIIALGFLAFVLQDLNDLWAIIKNQNDKIRDLQMLVISKILVISKAGIGI